MAKYVMVVQSKAAEGRDDEYNAWYDTIHLDDICALPGVKGGRRFEFDSALGSPPGLPYLAIFEIETDDVEAFSAEMNARAVSGQMRLSDTIDGPASVLWFYRQRI